MVCTALLSVLLAGTAVNEPTSAPMLRAMEYARAPAILSVYMLPNEMRSGVAPAASAISISGTEAVSKQEPISASIFRISGAGFAFTAGEADGAAVADGETVA